MEERRLSAITEILLKLEEEGSLDVISELGKVLANTLEFLMDPKTVRYASLIGGILEALSRIDPRVLNAFLDAVGDCGEEVLSSEEFVEGLADQPRLSIPGFEGDEEMEKAAGLISFVGKKFLACISDKLADSMAHVSALMKIKT